MPTHICCRDCRFEAVVLEMDAERTIETHEEDEGHTVDSESFEGSKRLVTDEAKEIDQGKLEAARSAGAHDEFIAFVAEYPDSRVAETLETAISLDALDNFPGDAGSFGAALWEHGAKKASNPDSENRRRIEELFDKGRWPTWMQKEASEDELATDGGRDTLRLTDDGIEIPEDVNLSGGVVFRARGVTVDHKPGSQDLDFYPALEERHLDAEGVSVQNDHLSDDEVSIKPYGEQARTYEVTIPATDGGENEESSPIPLYKREEAVPEDATDLILLLAAEDGATYETVHEQLEQIEADAMHVEIGNIGGPVRADLGPYAQPKTHEPFRSLRLLKSVDYVEEFSQAQYEEGEELALTEKAREAVEVFRRGMLDEQREGLEEIGAETAPHATDVGEEVYPEPKEMCLEELREEYSERADIGFPEPEEHDRKMALWNELRYRADIEQPPCPHCGEGNWGQAPGEPVQCNSCGEYLGENPELRQEIQESWDEIMGRDDEEEPVTDGSGSVQSQSEITDRPAPRKMALPCIWDEVDELTERAVDPDKGDFYAIKDRFRKIALCLQVRLDVDYPDCPECGNHIQRNDDGTPICFERHHELPEEIAEEYERVDGRLWGTRGHNGGAR